MLPKLKLLYLPLVLFSTGYIIIYSLFDWIVFIYPGSLSDNNVIEISAAVALVWIPAIFILWPRIKLLDVKVEPGLRTFDHPFYFFIVVLLVLAPTIFAQKYLIIASQKLIHVQNIQEVKKSDITQYYQIKNWSFDRKIIGTSFEMTPLKHDDLDLYVYIVSPFMINSPFNNLLSKKWLGIKYHKQISNLLTEEEKKEEIENFKKTAYAEYSSQGLNGISYMAQLGKNIDRSAYLDAISQVSNAGAPIIIEGEREIFDTRNDGNLVAAISTYILGLLIWFGIVRSAELKGTV